MVDSRTVIYSRVNWSHLDQISAARFACADWVAQALTVDVMEKISSGLSELVGRDITFCRVVIKTSDTTRLYSRLAAKHTKANETQSMVDGDETKVSLGAYKSSDSDPMDPNKTRVGILHRNAAKKREPDESNNVSRSQESKLKNDDAAIESTSIELLGIPTWAVFRLISDLDGRYLTCRLPVATASRLVAGFLGASALGDDDVSMLPFDCGVLDYLAALLLRGTSFRLARETVIESDSVEPSHVRQGKAVPLSYLARCVCRDGTQQFDVYVDVDQSTQMEPVSVTSSPTCVRVLRQPVDETQLVARLDSHLGSMHFSSAILLGRFNLQIDDLLAIEVGDCIVTSLSAQPESFQTNKDSEMGASTDFEGAYRSGKIASGQIEIPALRLSTSVTWSVDQYLSDLPGEVTLKEVFMSDTKASAISKVTESSIKAGEFKDNNVAESNIADSKGTHSGFPKDITQGPAREVLRGVELDVAIELGRFSLPLSSLVESGKGDVIHLDKALSAGIRLRAGDAYIADGELVDIDGNFGVRINKVY